MPMHITKFKPVGTLSPLLTNVVLLNLKSKI